MLKAEGVLLQFPLRAREEIALQKVHLSRILTKSLDISNQVVWLP
jgi:hypothetical protein